MKRDLQMIKSCCNMRGACWIWRNGTEAKGRPVARFEGKVRYVRRMVFELNQGRALLPGQMIGARCGTLLCVSPNCAFNATLKEVHAIASALGRYSNHKTQLARRLAKARSSRIPPATIQQVRAMPTSKQARQASGLSKSWVNLIRRGVVRNTDYDQQGA